MIHSSSLDTAKPFDEFRVAMRLLIVYMPVSVLGDRRTVNVVSRSRAPETVFTLRLFVETSSPLFSEFASRAARVKSATL